MKPGVITIKDDFPGFATDAFVLPAHYDGDLDNVLIPHGMLVDRVERMAADIWASYSPGEEILCICVLKSAIGFFTALTSAMQRLNAESPHSKGHDVYSLSTVDENGDERSRPGLVARPLFFEFMRVQSYVDDRSSGNVVITGISDVENTVNGKNVLIVEDIVDTGKTMQNLLAYFESLEPKSLKVATLIRKRCPESTDYIPDFLGFDIPNKFVVGFTIDYNQHFRDLPHLCIISDQGKRKYAAKK